jgi:O-antigen ligase
MSTTALAAPTVIDQDNVRQRRWISIKNLLLLGLVIPAFYLIDHDFLASQRYQFANDYFDNENQTADAIEEVGSRSAPARLLLGMIGFASLFVPSRVGTRMPNAVLIALLVFFAFMAASTLWSVNPPMTVQKSSSLLLLVFASMGMSRHFTLYEITRLIPVVCLAYIFFGVLAEVRLGTFEPYLSGYRFVGTCHPNTLAVYATVCCLAATVYQAGRPKLTTWTILLLAIGIVAFVMTKSRTTFVASAISVLALGYLRLRPSWRAFVFSAVLFGVACGGMMLTLASKQTVALFGNSMAMGRTENVSNLTGRLPLWEELSGPIMQRPILGHGYLAFWDKSRIERLGDTLGWEIPHGHNMYIDVLIDGGAVGLLLFVVFYLTSLVTALRQYRRHRDPAIAFAFSLIVFALVHGTAESLFKLPTFLTFVVLAVALRIGGLPREGS